MATITTVSHGNYLNTPRIQYISLTAFNNDFFQYTTSLNPQTFVTTGSLSAVTGATAANCPANRILRENGKKLYPPGLITANSTAASVGPYPGVTTYMVGVYDAISGLSGYIDPNSQVFAVYNGDKPNYVPRGIDPNTGAVDQGSGVYTLGLGQFGSYLNVGSYISTGTYVQAGTELQAATKVGYGGPAYSGVQTVTQATSRATTVTKNGPVVDIEVFAAVLNAHSQVGIPFSNTSMAATDTLMCVHLSGGTVGTYVVYGRVTAAGTATITLGNVTASNTASESPVIRVYVLKS